MAISFAGERTEVLMRRCTSSAAVCKPKGNTVEVLPTMIFWESSSPPESSAVMLASKKKP
jgi:hypothetical protein